jgi:hypothetical protein
MGRPGRWIEWFRASVLLVALAWLATGKAIFVIEPAETGSQPELRKAMRHHVTPRLAADPRVDRLVVNLPFDEGATDPNVAAVIELYGAAQDLRALAKELDASLDADARLHAYLVGERVPRRQVKDWPDGTQTPGVKMVALMVRDSDLSPQAFDAYWRDVHTPIALAHTVQVLHYSQNTVVELLTEGSEPIDGIVGEQFAAPGYSRDRMFGHPIEFIRGVASGWQFIDFGQTRNQLMVETVVRCCPNQ